MPPAPPELGEAVQQHHQRSVTGLGDVETGAVRGDEPVPPRTADQRVRGLHTARWQFVAGLEIRGGPPGHAPATSLRLPRTAARVSFVERIARSGGLILLTSRYATSTSSTASSSIPALTTRKASHGA